MSKFEKKHNFLFFNLVNTLLKKDVYCLGSGPKKQKIVY